MYHFLNYTGITLPQEYTPKQGSSALGNTYEQGAEHS